MKDRFSVAVKVEHIHAALEMLKWVKSNTPSFVADWVEDDDNGGSDQRGFIYTMYFTDEKDAMIFELRWG